MTKESLDRKLRAVTTKSHIADSLRSSIEQVSAMKDYIRGFSAYTTEVAGGICRKQGLYRY